VARRAAIDPGPHTDRVALGYGVWVGGAVALVIAAASPVLAAFLRLGSVVPVLLVACSLAPFAVTSAAQGLLQGAERFGRLAAVFVIASALRLACGGAAVALGYGVTGAIAGTAVAAVLAAVPAVVLAMRAVDVRATLRRPRGHDSDIAHVVLAVGGLLVLANIDVLLGRHYLTAEAAGLYAVGALVARATYWAPQFISVSVFSRLTDPDQRRRLLPRSLAIVAAIGTVATLLTFFLAEPILTAVFGARYAPLAPYLWWFAFTGSVQAVAQLLISSGIAAADRWTPLLVWSGIGVELLLVATVGHGSIQAVVASAAASAAAVAAALGLRARTVLRRTPSVSLAHAER
jgi:O-antigen/teichoic acid export membrane protein